MRIKHKANVRIASDIDMKNILFGLDDALAEVVIDDFDMHTSGNFSILDTANENLSLGDITSVKGLYLYVSNDCKMKLNGGSEQIQLRESSTTTGVTAKFFIEADITAVNIENDTAGETITGVYCMWGAST